MHCQLLLLVSLTWSIQRVLGIFFYFTIPGKSGKICRYGFFQFLQTEDGVCLENDSGVLCPVLKLIFNVCYCAHCNEVIYGQENFDDDICSGAFNLEPKYGFDWIVPQSELLPFEINAGKSFMYFCWDSFMNEVGKELGFVSKNPQSYARKGCNHHKTWGTLDITYVAFRDKLLLFMPARIALLHWTYNRELLAIFKAS